MKTLAITLLFPLLLLAQDRKPEPAFAGQTEAPRPAKASPALNVETLATGLNGAWAMAFLPSGNILATVGELNGKNAQVSELTTEGEEVWTLVVDGMNLYRAERMPEDTGE